MIRAEIIADSVSPQGHRLTTFVLEFPRIVLAEFNAYRMLSRNSASSRAIPFEKMLKMVQENPFVPIRWMQDHSGMQGNKYFDDMTCKEAWSELDRCFNYEEYSKKPAVEHLTTLWLNACDNAIASAKVLSELGITKQIVNRLLEPFMWHKVIVTGSEWENFFALRAHEAAEIHIQALAHKMLEVYNDHQSEKLQPGEWHIPFGDKIDKTRMDDDFFHTKGLFPYIETQGYVLPTDDKVKVMIATARCARVSYNDFEGKDDYAADVKLHDRLLAAGHMSPFEHCAQAMTQEQYEKNFSAHALKGESLPWKQLGVCGNFRGFIQYRKTLAGENKSDNRVKK